jgi:hypothetical protein
MRGGNRMAVLVLGGLVGCGGSGGGPGDGQSVALDDLVAKMTEASCARSVRCGFVSDMTICQATYGPGIFGRQLFNDLGAAIATAKAGKAQYDAAAARACVDAVRTDNCAAQVDPAACDHVFAGTIPDGDRCIADEGCLPGSFCAAPTSSDTPCDGTCTAGGTLCNDDGDCAAGSACDRRMGGATSFGRCVTAVPAGAAGAPCGTNSSCQPGLYCTAENVCATPLPLGDACNGVVPGGPCAEGLRCTGTMCAAVAKKGEACDATVVCGGGLTSLGCDPTSNVCVDLPASGPCIGTGIFSCDPLHAFCDPSGAIPTCTPFASIGQSCDPAITGQCGTVLISPSLYCMSSSASAGTCATPPGSAACQP